MNKLLLLLLISFCISQSETMELKHIKIAQAASRRDKNLPIHETLKRRITFKLKFWSDARASDQNLSYCVDSKTITVNNPISNYKCFPKCNYDCNPSCSYTCSPICNYNSNPICIYNCNCCGVFI